MKRDIMNTANFCVIQKQGEIRVLCPEYPLPRKSFLEILEEVWEMIWG